MLQKLFQNHSQHNVPHARTDKIPSSRAPIGAKKHRLMQVIQSQYNKYKYYEQDLYSENAELPVKCMHFNKTKTEYVKGCAVEDDTLDCVWSC